LRAVGDIGTHWLDTVGFILCSPVTEVLADLSTFHTTRRRPKGEIKTFADSTNAETVGYTVNTEDFANALLVFGNGARGNLGVSQVASGRKNCIRIEIYGSKQSAWWCSENPDMLHLGRRDQANAVAFRAGAEFGDTGGYADYPAGHVEGFPDTFKMLYRSVYNAVIGDGKGDGLFATAEDGLTEARLCEAILQSHRERRWIKL